MVKESNCKKAAEFEKSDVMMTLENCYTYGKGVKKDHSKAEQLYMKAFELGNQNAVEYLAQ